MYIKYVLRMPACRNRCKDPLLADALVDALVALSGIRYLDLD